MRQKWVKAVGIFLVVFVSLFLGRWWVLVVESQKSRVEVPIPVYQPAVSNPQVDLPPSKDGDDDSDEPSGNYDFQAIAFHNYAKEKVEGAAGTAKPPAQEQTYEKVTTLAARTENFDSDEQKIRDTLQANQVLIQQEEKNGLKGGRLLNLTLGVSPDRVDAVVSGLKKAGELVAFQTVKTDKTHDYYSLLAQRLSLEKNKNDLMVLKNAGGKMADLLNLQEKIFNLEKEIEDLGVEISQFEGATGLCTVVLTLKEIGPGPSPWLLAIGALDWTVDCCLYFLTWAFSISVLFILIVWLVAMAKPLGVKGKKNTKVPSLREFFTPAPLKAHRAK